MEEKEEIPATGYILVWVIRDYVENGGGTDWERVEDEQDGLVIINKLNKDWKDKFELLHFSRYSGIVNIEPVKVVTQFRIK